jgi:CRISPR system Cascade subunit CasD
MNVLLLRLAGPMQSWGVQSRFTVRDTGLEPSKSGVIGLLCAALGRPRNEPVGDLAMLAMGVRVDQEGTMAYDYHTAGKGGILKASGSVERKNLVVSARYYLADARFLVGLEGDDLTLLKGLHNALGDPHWPLYLGRKSFVPGEPVWLENGLCENVALWHALEAHGWLGTDARRRPDPVRFVLEDPDGAEVRPDQPLSFAERRFAPRRVATKLVNAQDLPGFGNLAGLERAGGEPCTSPD